MSAANYDQTHEHRVAGGYKATLANPHTSDEAKAHAREYLDGHRQGDEPDVVGIESGGMTDDSLSGNTIGGYKATLSNPRTSEAAKEKARNILEGNADPSDYQGTGGDQHSNRVIGGYKATLSNDSTSDEAKAKARDIVEGDVDPSEYSERATDDAHTNRVLGGYKATIHNPNTSEEAKEKAHEILRQHGQDVE